MSGKKTDRLRYVDEIAPEHDRNTCNDTNMYNRAFSINDHGGRGTCYRCTLLKVATLGKGRTK